MRLRFRRCDPKQPTAERFAQHAPKCRVSFQDNNDRRPNQRLANQNLARVLNTPPQNGARYLSQQDHHSPTPVHHRSRSRSPWRENLSQYRRCNRPYSPQQGKPHPQGLTLCLAPAHSAQGCGFDYQHRCNKTRDSPQNHLHQTGGTTHLRALPAWHGPHAMAQSDWPIQTQPTPFARCVRFDQSLSPALKLPSTQQYGQRGLNAN